jgi:hypothetical protein
MVRIAGERGDHRHDSPTSTPLAIYFPGHSRKIADRPQHGAAELQHIEGTVRLGGATAFQTFR